MKTTTFYVTSAMAGAGILFALLMGDSLGLFAGRRAANSSAYTELKNASISAQ